MKKKSFSLLPCVAFLSLGLLSATPMAQATLLFYEPFSYTDDANLAGQKPPQGASAAWTRISGDVGTGVIESPGLTYSGLSTTGNAALLTPTSGVIQYGINLETSAQINGSSVYYMSFLLEKDNTGTRTFALLLGNTGGTGAKALYIGQATGGNTWAFGEDQGTITSTGVSSNGENPSLFVLQIDIANQTASMWLNPALDAPFPNTPTLTANLSGTGFSYSSIRLQAGSTSGGNTTSIGFFDEIRIGTTLSDVLPVPEPATAFLLVSGMAGLFVTRRRRQPFAASEPV
jgi:hypothetical protein